MKSKKKNHKGGTFTDWVFGSKKKNTVATYAVKKKNSGKITRKQQNKENTNRYLMTSSSPEIKETVARSRRNRGTYNVTYNNKKKGYVKTKELKKVVHTPERGFSWESE